MRGIEISVARLRCVQLADRDEMMLAELTAIIVRERSRCEQLVAELRGRLGSFALTEAARGDLDLALHTLEREIMRGEGTY